MSLFQDIYKDLVDKRLWPFALILIALLIGAPMMLSKPGESTVVAELPAGATDDNLGPELSLTRSSTTGFARAPRVSDHELDPFGARVDPKVVKLKSTTASIASGTTTSGGGGGGGTGVTPVTTDPGTDEPATTSPNTTPPVKTEEDDLLSILYTTAADTDAKEITDIRTLSPLPDAEDPFLVYVGRADGNKATFLVSADVVPSGPGTCSPSLTDCRTLTLGEGETEDFVLTTKGGTKVSITITDIVTTKVPVADGTTATAAAARLEAKTRVIGAKALQSVLDDPAVSKVLIKRHVKIRQY